MLNPQVLNIFQIQRAKAIVLELNSLSKSYNMASWRIGIVAGKKVFIQNILKTKSQMESGMYLPLQLGAIEAIQQSKEWFQELNTIYTKGGGYSSGRSAIS
ncbi:MAG: aminotransferase class I/II-fold pyridoxal phosphate-dependent enzyme [Flavobacteriales bacterium AspAUS03]